ncbi:TPA: hypothetical protein N0F65_001082 [Lagenidium giganteum]|uniref:FCP1 homology domain-containing protein n=1 Tax=Lagenidium giganteum TaxID=4803 RepID=A0AAV2YH06_9STRA|nr:TPA: hypothetical protein N0F65_001082 [Lagenidium giganteum]
MAETRRDTKRARAAAPTTATASASTSANGYYADPMSPIASTPMKRQRSKPENTKSTKPKHQHTATATPHASLRNAAPSGDEEFFSPRKLLKEYDEDDAATAEEKKENSAALAQAQEHATPAATPSSETGSPVDAMFSPMLKAPHRSANPSPASQDSHTDGNFLSTSSLGSAGHIADESTLPAEEASMVDEGEDTTDEAPETAFDPFYFMKTLPKYEEIVPHTRPIVLPAKSRHAHNVCLVLDLDETLVHCSVDHVEDPHLTFPVNFNGTDYIVNVKKRPHMEYFLRRVSKLFEVVVFTASHRAYAEKLLDLLDPRREYIKYRLYREDCLDVHGNYLKDLNVLGRHLSKVLLVDNSPHAFGYQVNNGIPIETWYDDESDEELLNLLPFLESIADTDDVRPIVEKQFKIQKLIDAAE